MRTAKQFETDLLRLLWRLLPVIFFTVCVFAGGCGNRDKEAAVPASGEEMGIQRHIRVGCFNTGEYYYWHDELDAIALELQRNGKVTGYEEKPRETMEQIWADLCACQSDNLEFVADAYYEQLYMTDEELDVAISRTDVDVMLAIGTTVGQYLTQRADEITYDYLVIGSADPVSAGIVGPGGERLNDKAFAILDENRYGRQIQAAYEQFHFRSVGVVYADREDAYSYSGIGQLEQKAEELGFEILRLHVNEIINEGEDERYYRELKEAYAELAPKVDALYITTATIDDTMLPWLLEDLKAARVVTIAQTSESQVEYGALMHIKVQDPIEEGTYVARCLMQYGDGATVADLEQKFEVAPSIYINQKAVEETGVKVPMATYLVADKVYREVKQGEE